MKKILAILLALTVVFAFAACGAKEDPAPETEAQTEAEEVVTDAAGEEATEAAGEEATEAAGEEATEAVEVTEEETTEEEKSAGLNSTDIAEVVEYYNAAVIKTNEGAEINGKNAMSLDGDITADGAIGAVLKVAMPIIDKTLAKNSGDQKRVPGKGKLTAADVSSASAVSENGKTKITIKLKNQKDGPSADGENGGSVARGIGTLGNIEGAINELGAELYSGRDTISLLYNDAFINATVDEGTGRIVAGRWHYKVNISIINAEIKLGLKFTAKNLKGIIDWNITL